MMSLDNAFADEELQAWHERFAKEPLMVQVKLPPKGKVDQPFTFKGGKKPAK